MKYIKSIALKLILDIVLLEIIFIAMTSLTFGQILFIAGFVALISYFVADLLVLAVSNNAIATLTDLALVFFTIYTFNFWSNFSAISFPAAFIASLVLAAGDWFFHKYMVKKIYPRINEESK